MEYFLIGISAVLAVVALTVFFPRACFIGVIAAAILFPPDLALKLDPLPRIGPSRIILGAFLLGLLLRLAVVKGEGVKIPRLTLGYFILAYLFCGTVSTVLSIEPLISIYALIGRDLIEQFLLFYLALYFLRSADQWRPMKAALLLTTVIVCLLGLYEFLTLSNPLYPDRGFFVRESIPRIQSFFFHPIALGSYMNLVAPFVLVEIVQSRRVHAKILYSFMLLAVVAVVFLTVSRGPWICLAIEFAMVGVYWVAKRRKQALLTVLFAALVLANAVVAYQFSETAQRMFAPILSPHTQDEASPEYYRVMLFRTVIDYMEGARWIYGYGPNVFFAAGLEARYSDHTVVITAADNHFLKILLEYGLAGLLAFIAMLAAAVAACHSAFRGAGEEHKMAALACLASATGFILVNTTAGMFHIYPLGTLFWLAVAFAVTTAGRSAGPAEALQGNGAPAKPGAAG